MADVEQKKKVKPTAIKAQKDKEWEYFEADEWYPAKFDEVETAEGNYGPYLKFKFTVLGGKLENGNAAKGKPCNALMDANLSPSSTLWKWVKAMIEDEPVLEKSYDLTAYYGEKFRILIIDRKPKKGETKRYQTIKTIKRKRKEESTKEE